MYEDFYGFKEKPFSMLPDPGFLFLSKKHQTALTLLEYGILNHVGFCVITGEPGAGKTTLIRAILQRTGENISVGLITNTHQSFGGLLDWVLSAFDLHRPNLTSVEMHQVFMEYLIEEYANNRTVLLVVDEAQNMKPDTLEELRMLSNVNSEKDQLLQVVLSGQPALKEMLSRPELMQFAQRIGVDYHLDELNLEETCGYIQHRLLTAGAERDVFTPAACERIYNYSGGTPRLINLLCETVLVYGFADQLEVIEFDLVDEMVRERMKGSVVPIVNRDVGRPDSKEANDKLESNFPWIVIDSEEEGLKSAVEKVAALSLDDKSSTVSAEDTASIESVVIEASTEQDASKEVTDAQEEAVEVITQEKKTEPTSVEEKPQSGDVLEETTPTSTPAATNKPAPKVTGDVIPPVEKREMVEATDPFIKYGVIAIVFALILIIVTVMLGDSDDKNLEVIEKEAIGQEAIDSQKQEKLQIEVEAIAMEKMAVEAEALKELEAAALLKSEEKRVKVAAEKKTVDDKAVAEKKAVEDKAAKKQAEKKAAQQKSEEKALVDKAAKKKKIRDEQKRIAIIKEREREKKYAVEREKRKAAKIAEEERLRDEEEVRRLEQEWLEKERKNLEMLDSSQVTEPDMKPAVLEGKTVTSEKSNNPDCSGPTARFKANCR